MERLPGAGPVAPGEGVIEEDDIELPFSNQMLKFKENKGKNFTISGVNMSVEMEVNSGDIILSGSHVILKITRNCGSVENRGLRNLVEIGSQDGIGRHRDWGLESRIIVHHRRIGGDAPQPVPRPIFMINNPPAHQDRYDAEYFHGRHHIGLERIRDQNALQMQQVLFADAQQNLEIQGIGLRREAPVLYHPENAARLHAQQGGYNRDPYGLADMIPQARNPHLHRGGIPQERQQVVVPSPQQIQGPRMPQTPLVQPGAHGNQGMDVPPPQQNDAASTPNPNGPPHFHAPKWQPHYQTEVGKRLERGIMTFKKEIVEIEKIEFAQAEKELSKRYYVDPKQDDKGIVPFCRVCGEYSGRSDKGRLNCYVDCDKMHTYHLSCLEPWMLHSARCPATGCGQSVNCIKTFKPKDLPLGGGAEGKKTDHPTL